MVEQGKISVPEFVERFDKENATDVAAGCISQKLADVCGLDVISAIASVRATPRKYFAKAISALRQAGLLVVALTNNFKETGDASLANVVTPMFDHVIESSKVGCRKPGVRCGLSSEWVETGWISWESRSPATLPRNSFWRAL